MNQVNSRSEKSSTFFGRSNFCRLNNYKNIKKRLALACSWLTDIAQVHSEDQINAGHRENNQQQHWKGAIRGEYHVKTAEWGFVCPVWHSGQAVKSLIMAHAVLPNQALLDSAVKAADFILANSIAVNRDELLLLAFEDFPDKVNTSAILEALDGLLMLSDETGNQDYRDAAVKAMNWVANNAYIRGEGLFRDAYDPKEQYFIPHAKGTPGRPLLDDGMFLKGFRLTGNRGFLKTAMETADRLLQEESPPGNWINFLPCIKKDGRIHPRHAYWWGLPMLDIYKYTDDVKYLEAFTRSVKWYEKAMRMDGGIIRGTYTDFRTDSFGHATSGSACAVIMFITYLKQTGDEQIIPFIEKGLSFCESMQMLSPEDPNLTGVIMEKVLPPDGTDCSPYHVRDLGTIFYIQAACMWLDYISSHHKYQEEKKEVVL